MRLPFRDGPPIDIGHSRATAERCLKRISNSSRMTSEYQREYREFMFEYEKLGHMKEVPHASNDEQCVYIPHHPVIRESSATTRLRVVFNASSVTSNGSSLNDHLLAAPKLQIDLASVILRWRRHRFVYTADIAKMFRQIKVDPRDVNYQRILWSANAFEQPKTYQLLQSLTEPHPRRILLCAC